MKFLIDAQITYKLAKHLKAKGIDVIHVTQLQHKDQSSDQEIIQIADVQNRIVLTKDRDFINSFIIKKTPKQLLFISAGNLNNDELFRLLDSNLEGILEGFKSHSFIELTSNYIIFHK